MRKKFVRDVFRLTAAIIVFATVMWFFVLMIGEMIHSHNSSERQTIELQQVLDVDAQYRQTDNSRMQHNNGEAIYVSIDEDDFTDKQITTIKSALDYIFGLVGDVNPNYHYKMVDDVNIGAYQHKARISFSSREVPGALGCAERRSSFFSGSSKGVLNLEGAVIFDEDYCEEDSNHFYYTALHELLHLFGMNDVYVRNRIYYFNTYMNVQIDDTLKLITPNDYKMLVACYAKDMTYLSYTEKQAYIAELKEKIQAYSTYYYTSFDSLRNDEELLSRAEEMANVNYDVEKLSGKFDMTFTLQLLNGNKVAKVAVDNGKYDLCIYDQENQLLESCQGDAYRINNQLFLQGIHFKQFKDGKETFTDLYISQPTDDEDGFNMHDLFGNFYSDDGEICVSNA